MTIGIFVKYRKNFLKKTSKDIKVQIINKIKIKRPTKFFFDDECFKNY